jgi:hypothetical protein
MTMYLKTNVVLPAVPEWAIARPTMPNPSKPKPIPTDNPPKPSNNELRVALAA